MNQLFFYLKFASKYMLQSLIYRKYQSAVEEAEPPVTFLYCHHPPSSLAIFHKETWNDNKRFCVKLNRKNCIGIYI